jgi:heat shock protein HslJ
MDPRPAARPSVGRFAALAALVTLALVACTGGGSSPSVEPLSATPLEGTSWQLVDYVGPNGGLVAVPQAVAASATFDAGKISGNAGCNDYTGSYTLDGDKIAVDGLAMTAMACPEIQMALEQAYTTTLSKVATYAIAGNALELKTAEGTVGLRYRVAERPSLTKTRWLATMINSGSGAVVSVVGGSRVTAIFAEAGTVAGSGGCNDYSGPYTVDGSSIEIGPLMATEKACVEAAVNQQEAAYFAALEKVATFDFKGDRLELRAGDGSLQVEYRPTLP